MDIHMPVMDGLEAASKIIGLGSKTPIVALTANIMANDLEYYKNSGMVDVLGKPFAAQELWTCLMKFLRVTEVSSVDTNQQSALDEEYGKQMQNFFVNRNQTTYKLICDAIEAGDGVLAHRIVHTLKSNAGQIKEVKLQEAAAIVEAMLKEEKIQLGDEQMLLLESELNCVLEKLATLLSETAAKDMQIITDARKIIEIMENLEPMLKNYQTDCLDLLNEIRQIPEAEKLARLVEVLNYEEALIELAIIKERAGMEK